MAFERKLLLFEESSFTVQLQIHFQKGIARGIAIFGSD